MENLTFPAFISVDFHGLVETKDDTLKFEFGSHHGGIRLIDKKRKMFLFSSADVHKLSEYFGSKTLDDFQNNWIECHSEEMMYSDESDFTVHRLLCMICYIEPTTEKIEDIFNDIA